MLLASDNGILQLSKFFESHKKYIADLVNEVYTMKQVDEIIDQSQIADLFEIMNKWGQAI